MANKYGYVLDASGNAIPMADPGAVQRGEVVALAEDSNKLGGLDAGDYVLAEDAANLVGIRMKLMWENASPTSQFGSQHLTVAHEEFKLLLFNASEHTTSGNSTNSVLVPGNAAMIYSTNGSVGMCARLVSFSEGTIYIGNGYQATSGWKNDDTVCIPLKIYGIK